MNNFSLFTEVALRCSRITTEQYSTSFAYAIRLLHKDLHGPIHAIYGLVRFADEIVDTFHGYDKAGLLKNFKEDTFKAIAAGISLNPILHAFQQTVQQFNIDQGLIRAFFNSMEMDLDKQQYHNAQELDDYIYGSAEVVGLMCLYVFCEGRREQFDLLKPAARSLGAAFQKVNFLRDIKADYQQLNRQYFPGMHFDSFDGALKQRIEAGIEKDFRDALAGIKQLPRKAKFGVYVAYRYYYSLFRKIRRLPAGEIMEKRVRINNAVKMWIVGKAGVKRGLEMI
jgi:phytoene/squalene synthetase